MMERDLLHARAWRQGSDEGWLAIDLIGGDRLYRLQTETSPPPELPAPFLVSGRDGSCVPLPDGGVRLSEGAFWALLDPLRPWPFADGVASGALEAENQLRELVLRFRRRARWWQNLESEVRAGCRNLLRGRKPDLLPLLTMLTDLPLKPLATSARELEPEKQDPAVQDLVVPPELPASSRAMRAFFLEEDALGALYGEHFRPREEQAIMAEEVSASLERGEALLLEAGTGVGKTLAYLLPLLTAVRHGEQRAVVSTHTKALQSQILEQDLPRLKPLLGDKSFNLLMGRANYLCLRQRLAYAQRPVENFDQALAAASFRLWLAVTSDGLREELSHHPLLGPDLDRIFFRSDNCLPGQCYEGDRCYVQRARRRARDADLLVVNHSLLMHDLKAGHMLLGEIDYLVVDEAHRLPAVALESHAVACGPRRLDEIRDLLGSRHKEGSRFELLDLLAARLEPLGKDGAKAARRLVDYSRALRRAFGAYQDWWQALADRVDSVMPQPHQRLGRARVRDKSEAFGIMRRETAELLIRLAEAGTAFADLKRATDKLEDLSSGLEDDLAQVASSGTLLRQLEQDVRFLMEDEDEDWVTWVQPGPESGVRVLGATLLEAGTVLRGYWEDTPYAPIMTSATLAVGEDYQHMMGELGLLRRRPPCRTVTCPSPFDYDRQALILAPRYFPAPGARDFSQAIGEVMRTLAMNVPRKTMGLYTSFQMIRHSCEVLAEAGLTDDPHSTCGPVILAQDPRVPAGGLLDKFRAHRRAMLLGTATFWEGVDFPGRDLEILVVTKLPFLVPSDPWVEARCERISAAGDNPFIRFMVRDAVLRLRQGFGRLIRRLGDRGVVIILDNRLHTKNYGATFLSALPSVPATFGDADDLVGRIEQFFQQD
ncbi:hypothetical protein CSB20_05710 [bacterium DOLZORAL124_64_63]|nr:MAG: hypothetical protein CSB20_05710 [bacterium DOLZORAL124_64_63]